MGRLRFFLRRAGERYAADEFSYIPAEPAYIDPYLFAPVAQGLWRQHELWDGTYTLGDLMDIHEMLALRSENERRMIRAAKNQL